YKPLTHPREFRFLILQQGQIDDPIYCNLVHKNFSALALVEYEAISYTGPTRLEINTSKTIYLGGFPFSVTYNCEVVLKRVRTRGRLRIWIDAVCINQDDINERSYQVNLMPNIYSLAEKVFVYPGELSDEETKTLEPLEPYEVRETARLRRPFVSIEDPNSFGCSKRNDIAPFLFKRRYFSRVLILQEVSLAKEAVVICDRYEIFLDFFRACVGAHGSLGPTVLTIEPRKFRQESDLLDLLDYASPRDATDPRDKVFGVFGMIPLARQTFGLIANYNATTEATYTDIALRIAD
ncbi:heterokaryon incompatibility protein-domain-containing protein, partial [Podospora fimiseda]